ncbi:Ca-activated chloride channel family protein [Stigmatella aurantiaca]|uniref:Ca-activated chloride channel family protein n=1 Tax=Stigmatella aurantiaca TaxID=41 RepID=A0A1H7ZYP1_STIAU|nr:VIT domain-containing protein [Stigmatella aurantiaca]SEM63782.1 Ca-activated chloride channel family protein [Stigmatella aurantiaca]
MNTALPGCGLYTRDGAKVPLQGVEVTGELLGSHARVRVRQRYLNTERRPVEAVYVFPLPSDGTLTGFSLECNGRRLQGVVKEREEAFRTYDDAITAGHGAALLDQERANVFTAQVGNLLPDEETYVEVEFLQAIQVEEGSVRWMLPTLVAPRYIPGAPQGDRTAHGTASPTPRVPDADRITPPMGNVGYGLKLDLKVDLGREVVVESPSHALSLEKEGTRVRVKFARDEVALDRDFVLTVRSPDTSTQLTPLVAHRQGEKPGTFALTVVPDLLGLAAGPKRQEVVFVVDTSGSMDGESLPQAQGALRLCLRHLREGDRFNIIAFDTSFQTFAPEPAVFTQKTLEQADRWVAALSAAGGTELLQPMLAAVQGVPDGVVVLLTDGQVGNESEILQAVLGARKTARIYSFGIGTNVSDALLRDLARQTGGAVEFIHPGERIDDKVVAQFSRALAPRITGLQAQFEGVEGVELAPAELPPLVDAVPWTLLGRYPTPGQGKVTLRGRSGTEPFVLTVPVDFPAVSDRPVVEKWWAAERIRGWEAAELDSRRAQRMKERIVQLAVEHQLVTRHTSFVVVEERTGERRASGQPETRVVPVHAPAGWAMLGTAHSQGQQDGAMAVPPPGAAPKPLRKPSLVARGVAPQGIPAPAPAMAASRSRAQREEETTGSFLTLDASEAPELALHEGSGGFPVPPPPAAPAPAPAKKKGLLDGLFGKAEAPALAKEASRREKAAAAPEPQGPEDATTLLSRQLASGLWDGAGPGTEAERQARATALALLELLRQGITSQHPLHGAQVKKAVEALLQLTPGLGHAPPVVELALGVAWLVAAGPRTRGRIAQAAQPLAGLSTRMGDEVALRQHVDALATR